jgi:endonuclease/exonuclease/phosphatase family metal-dependent hydrolase
MPDASRMPHGDAGDVRILHWNIHSWRDEAGTLNTGAVIKLISHTHPHVVSLTEVDETWSTPLILSQVAASCGYTWIFCPSFEFGTGASAGGFGNALLARISVTAVQHWQLFTPDRPYDRTEPTEPRSATLARLAFGGAAFWVGSTHLPRGNPADRAAAAGKLQQMVPRLDAPWLICGDFNAPPQNCFVDSRDIRLPPLPQPTYPARQPAEPIDYCITVPGITAHTTVLQAEGSDHLPLLISTSPEHLPP